MYGALLGIRKRVHCHSAHAHSCYTHVVMPACFSCLSSRTSYDHV